MEKNIRKNKHWLKDVLSACWNVVNFTRKAFLNILFLIVAFVIVAALLANTEAPTPVAKNSILKLKLVGNIVEQKAFVDPYSEILMGALGEKDSPPEMLLTDILLAIKEAENDANISALYLDLHSLFGAGLSKLQEIGLALTQFKQRSNKPVIVYGDYFSQSQYYLASFADEVILHPMGAVGMDGFGRYRMYYKSALEKLKVNAHIFRVGTFKSAVEPYIRDDMSQPAKEANNQWLGDLWQQYKSDIAQNRQFDFANFNENLDDYLSKFKQANGSFAEFAKQNGWVDKLMTRQQFDNYIEKDWLENKPKFVSISNYLSNIKIQDELELTPANIGIVVAQGTIYNGKRNPGEVGGDSTAKLLKQARLNSNIKAVVLRVDSPGGSAFASEVIRNEIEALKQAGKPVIASMSTLAASGGYWISASADEIWASPTTITGSIGIFGMFLTFEDSLSYLGLNTDGVGTTEMSGLSATRKLNPQMAQIIQTSVENGYEQFLGLVANERDMSKQEVDSIAQGRVWSGYKAKELGLVDELGSFEQAIAAAATRANLTTYKTRVITKPISPMDQLMMDMFTTVMPVSNNQLPTDHGIVKILTEVGKELSLWTEFNDPAATYVYCEECTVDLN